jgi:hypothetical protein
MSFLNLVDETVGNIDLTKSYVYVLELEDERYYIGRTSNFMQRMTEHFGGNGSIYTKKYKPIKIKEVVEESNIYSERDKTLEYMNLHGYEKVRGYTWCSEKMLHPPKIKKKSKENLEKKVYDNPDIRNMYLVENKDIIEIGNYLNRSPGSIAYSLETMGIVERRQLSRGYFDYIFSDMYDKSKKDREILRLDMKRIKIDIKQDSSLSKEELKNIKDRIREKIKEVK